MTFEVIVFILLLTAAVCDIGIPFVIGRRYPGYNHLLDTVSTLGTRNSPVKKLEQSNLVVIGLLLTIFSIFQNLLFTEKTVLTNLYGIGAFLFGIGSILAGIFPEDTKHSEETVSGKIHGIASGIGFLFLGLNPFWAVRIVQFQELSVINIVLFITATTSFLLFLLSEKREEGLLKYTGLFQRINLTALYSVLIINFEHAFLK
jgi:hypothetical membrane protein